MVWDYLIKPELMEQWLMKNDFQPVVGLGLAENFDMSRPAVSKHIKILHTAGFISIRDIGRERYCTLKSAGFRELQNWISYYDSFWASKLKKLETLLNNKLPN
ncbi:helix-turn-helix transcriptional regulator [Chitinophaga eiseniae]|uniref:Helix-turn-helix transcriptional regulator n=2 Tax=Chitinophaga eiseniae TaxID=634771 RepID=A0A847SWX5_9BACT|nr:helix-turn-helix transcriptional regulator [Chitinophaga eiseniae]